MIGRWRWRLARAWALAIVAVVVVVGPLAGWLRRDDGTRDEDD